MSSNPSLDAGIPVLTEIIPVGMPVSTVSTVSAADNANAAKPLPSIAIPVPATWESPAPPEVQPAESAKPAAGLSEEQLERLEHEIRERVLYQVLERIDFVLEQRVRDSLADVLQTAVEHLAGEIKNGLHHSMKDVITRAVTQEISKLQISKK